MLMVIILLILCSITASAADSTAFDEKLVARVLHAHTGSDCIARHVCPGAKYLLLGLRKDDFDEYPLSPEKRELLKQAYKSMAKKVHPDKNKSPNAYEAFTVVRETFLRLNDDMHRYLYKVQLNELEDMSAEKFEEYRRKVEFVDRNDMDDGESRRAIGMEMEQRKRKYWSFHSEIARIFGKLGDGLLYMILSSFRFVNRVAVYVLTGK
jgi:hypothetical protein